MDGDSSSISGCADILGATIMLTPANANPGSPPANFWQGTWTGTSPPGTYTVGVNKIHMSWTNGGSTCTFDLSGTVNGTYRGATPNGQISVPTAPVQGLTVSNSNGAFLCGFIGANNGQTITIAGTLFET